MSEPERMHDLVVIGGGIAGLTMAARASEGGIAPVVLEQGEGNDYPCNSRYSGGILHVAYHDIGSPPASLAAAIRDAMGADADDTLIDATVERCPQVIAWLTTFDIRFVKASPTPWHRWTLAPPRPLQPGLAFPGCGPDRLLGALADRLAANGGQRLLGHRAVRVERADDGFVVVAVTRTGTRSLRTRAVALADGGFQGDRDLVRRHVSARPDTFVQRGAGTGQGLALRVAETLGCSLSRMDRFYGHLLSRDALSNPALWPYPQIDATAKAGIVVTQDGRRFVDEGRGGVFIVNALAKLDDPAGCFVVLDSAIWDTAGRESLYPANPHLVDGGGTLHRADDLHALATSAGIDAAALARTVRDYNAAVAAGAAALATLDVPRSGKPMSIAHGPYLAIPLCPGITNTMGGIAVDAHGGALDRAGSSIPGLYAIGASAGGLEGGANVGYVGGLMRGLTSGMAAAEHLLASTGKSTGTAAPPSARAQAHAMLRHLARHGTAFSAAIAMGGAVVLATLLWPIVGWVGLALGAALGVVLYAAAKAFTEMAAIVLDTLVPR